MIGQFCEQLLIVIEACVDMLISGPLHVHRKMLLYFSLQQPVIDYK